MARTLSLALTSFGSFLAAIRGRVAEGRDLVAQTFAVLLNPLNVLALGPLPGLAFDVPQALLPSVPGRPVL
ncbi:hypothetical protein [Candidatus Amarobacter glycogenicus]|uniref:hypothetical protein n=1 Tax=Candidatus Amarobacter glycogenicus TaxID=3140699 RepID=UPI0031CC6A1E